MTQALAQARLFLGQEHEHGLFVFGIPDAEVDLGEAEVRGHFHFRDGNQGLGAKNIDALLLQDDAEVALDQFTYLALTFGFHYERIF